MLKGKEFNKYTGAMLGLLTRAMSIQVWIVLDSKISKESLHDAGRLIGERTWYCNFAKNNKTAVFGENYSSQAFIALKTPTHIVKAPKFNLVVADDKKAANTMITGTLQLQGFEVFQVTNALEALNRIDMLKGNLSAIYMEGNIAKERSSMIIPRIRKINPDIKVIVIVDDQEAKEEVEKLNPDYIGVLPTNATAVADAVKALLISDLASNKASSVE